MMADEEVGLVKNGEHHTYDAIPVEPEPALSKHVYMYTPRRDRTPYWPIQEAPIAGSAGPFILMLQRKTLLQGLAVYGDWLKVRYGNREGWVQVYNDGQRVVVPVDSYRRHQVWPGRNTFWCGGRLMLGADMWVFGSTNLMMAVPSVPFVIAVCLKFPGKLAVILTAVTLGLLALAFTLLWTVRFLIAL
jgi:hypothetical protein